MSNLFLPHLAIDQQYSRQGNRISRKLTVSGTSYVSHIECASAAPADAARAWVVSYLRGAAPVYPDATRSFTMVDMFCGAGGLAFGVLEGGRSVGVEIRPRLALDANETALDIYQRNIGVDAPLIRDVSRVVDYKINGSGTNADFGYEPSILDPLVKDLAYGVDLLIGGPPCQGHSNLNNRTRRQDERNLLYLTVPAVAVASKARVVIIENVPDVLNDKHSVVATTRALLVKAGYSISEAVLSAHRFGAAQRRRRHFLMAVREPGIEFSLSELAEHLEMPEITVGHVLKDLQKKEGRTAFDTAAVLSAANKRRIDWLFDSDQDDLPNHIRPLCHQEKHTYPSVYGRLKWNEQSGTITGGFLSPGRGRYIHPNERRALTPHEGARLQAFPDSFQFIGDTMRAGKTILATAIGDAVPPALGQVVGTLGLSLVQALDC